MTQIAIPAQVVNGRLCHDADLSKWEGQSVVATLTVTASGSTEEKDTPQKIEESVDVEPPPWLEVENDVYFPMTVPEKLLQKKTLIVETGTPSIILPEELPDE